MASPLDNVGPVTTVFTGPSTCLSTTSFIGNGIAGFYVAAFWSDATECYPPGTQSLDLHTAYYYSPGICPSGWAPVASLESGFPITASDYSQKALAPKGTTAWLCCPSGFAPDRPWSSTLWHNTRDCASTVPRHSTMTNVWMTTDPVGALSTIIASTRLMVLAKGIPIMWQQSDTAVVDWWETANPLLSAPTTTSSSFPTGQTIFRTVTGPGGSVSTLSDEITPSSTGAQDPSDSQSATQSSDLSTGAKIGIGVSVGVAIIAIGVAVYLFICFMRASKATAGTFSGPQHHLGKGQKQQRPKVELQGDDLARTELETRANTHEFEAPRQVYELPGPARQ
ncbi:hypothetical protein QBC36DRAFT_379673 [Triangularia setosa]|uniref:Uncharacterized protein n=1 Tax=Triangularia setosa TaxID=2587417 RepID=A0AAN6W4F5_9PEZI|nr:hypothetical protein QBC36DRAFT_379673 [Podospora setosa]